MLAAMGVVAAIRVSSYYNSTLSTDVAKILPLALLGIMLIDNTLLRLSDSTEGIREAALQWETMIYYLIGVVVLEFALRIASGAWGFFTDTGRAVEPPIGPVESQVDLAEPPPGEVAVDSGSALHGPPDAPADGSATANSNPAADVDTEGPRFGHVPSK